MTKTLLPLFIILSLTACHERQGPEPKTSKFTEQLFTSSPKTHVTDELPMKEKGRVTNVVKEEVVSVVQSNDEIVEDIPILEDDLPALPTPVMVEERTETPTVVQTSKQTFRGGKISDGLDIKTIRSSESATRSRLVFDIYKSNIKATQAGNYIFTYNPLKKQITAVVNGYRKFSALTPNKTRSFPSNKIINNIKMDKYMDDSGFKFNINLNTSASVNVFELKSPARIVVDITPN